MDENNLKEVRKLAAIMFTDMVGYSALTQKNEALALELLKSHNELLRPVVSRFGGREIKTIGDAFLIEFASALETISCAVEMQRTLHNYNATAPVGRNIQIRIGIHVGDVIHREGDVFGDGVNIAARIEPLAPSGGICISEDVFRQIHNKTETEFIRLGKKNLKNIQIAAAIYKIVLPWEQSESGVIAQLTFKFGKRNLRRATIFALMALIIGILFVFRKSFSVVAANPDMTVSSLQNPFADITYPALSKDGRWVALAGRDPDGRYDVYLANTTGGAPRRVTSDTREYISSVDISPDDNSIAYDRYYKDTVREIWTAPTLGGTSRLLVEGGYYPHWRPDGRRIAYVRTTEQKGELRTLALWSVDPSGRDNRLEFVDSTKWIGSVSFSYAPDGNSVAWLRSFGENPNNYEEIVVRNLASGKEHQLTHDKTRLDEICWTSRDVIVFSSKRGGSTNLWFVPLSGGTPVQLTRGPGPDLGVKVSLDGERLVYMQRSVVGYLGVLNVDRGDIRQVTYEDRLALDPAISPDGKSIVYVAPSGDVVFANETDIYVIDRDGSNQRRITGGGLITRNPLWSPDGKWIAYDGWGGPVDSLAQSGVYLVASNGQRAPKRLTDGGVNKWLDSNTIIIKRNLRSWLIHLAGSPTRRFFQDSCSIGEISDQFISYWDNRKEHRGPWILPRHILESSPDDSIEILKSSVRYQRYPKEINYIQSQNGRGLYTWKADGSIWEMKFPEGSSRQLKGILPREVLNWPKCMSYQRNELAFVRPREVSKLLMIEKPFKE